MKEIPLTKGLVAIVDDGDYAELSKHKWYAIEHRNTFYAVRAIYPNGHGRGKRVWMHREIVRPPRNRQIDHINGNGLDNRRTNLRACSHGQNHINSKLRSDNTSGYRGVSRFRGSWVARIATPRGRAFLGRYSDPAEAAKVYDSFARIYHGEFARLNFPASI